MISTKDKRFWFASYEAYPEKSLWLLTGKTKEIVRKSLVNLNRIGIVYQLTWAKLSYLTGCIIPSTAGHQEPAFGDLVFLKDKCEVRVLEYIYLGG